MKTLLLATLLFLGLNAQSAVLCHTPNQSKSFSIEGQNVSFFNAFKKDAKRQIASVSRSKMLEGSMTKVLNFEGSKHTIHIQDMKSFNDVNDYMVIKSKKGHEMTYPLNCSYK